jgi:hypothetical protein
MIRKPSQLIATTALAALAGAACTSDPATLGSVDSELAVIPRGSTCAQLGLGNQQLTLPGPVAGGTYALDASNSLDITYYDDTNTIFYFNNATIRITGVLVSIGDRTLMWDMPGGADAWPSLHGPTDPETGYINEPEEISFCFDYSLRVQPSPYAHHAQRPTWTITKTGRSDRLVLSEGQSELVEYDVTVSPGTVSSAGQFIEGPVFLNNASPFTVTVGEVTTMVGDLAATITCPSPAPFTMAPFQWMECSFHADVPDTSDRNVVGSASVSHGLMITTQEVVASFAAHNVGTTVLDDCVAVRDEAVPYEDHFLGTVCVADGETTFSFSQELGPFECGDFAVTTVASYEGLDTGGTADAAWTVNGEVACNPGCTLSQNYWKRHSHFGPRRYNPTWDQIGAQGEDTPFFRSGGTHIQAMWRIGLGNPYWTLAKSYIAAKLNRFNGAQFTPGTLTAFNAATALLEQYTPSQVALNNTVRKQFTKNAAALKDFNSGRTGPGKCTCKPDLSDDD